MSKDFHCKPTPRERSVADALANAGRLRRELPLVVQVSASDWDNVILADHIKYLETVIETLRN